MGDFCFARLKIPEKKKKLCLAGAVNSNCHSEPVAKFLAVLFNAVF